MTTLVERTTVSERATLSKHTTLSERATLQEAIKNLPEEMLKDLAQFIEFLLFKSQQQQNKNQTNGSETKSDTPPYKPVYFPEGIAKNTDDLSIEDFRKLRREFGGGTVGEDHD